MTRLLAAACARDWSSKCWLFYILGSLAEDRSTVKLTPSDGLTCLREASLSEHVLRRLLSFGIGASRVWSPGLVGMSEKERHPRAVVIFLVGGGAVAGMRTFLAISVLAAGGAEYSCASAGMSQRA